jgi:hypothetical protein
MDHNMAMRKKKSLPWGGSWRGITRRDHRLAIFRGQLLFLLAYEAYERPSLEGPGDAAEAGLFRPLPHCHVCGYRGTAADRRLSAPRPIAIVPPEKQTRNGEGEKDVAPTASPLH